MITCIILISIGIIALLVVLGVISKTSKIDKNAETVEGIIYENDLSPYNFDQQNNDAMPIVRFVTKEDKKWITEKCDVGFASNIDKQGTKVTVVYNKLNPTEFYIKDWKRGLIINLFLIASIITITIGLYKLYILLK